MGYRTRETVCITRLLPLARLTKRQREQCMALRREAGRCWAALVTAHREARCDVTQITICGAGWSVIVME